MFRSTRRTRAVTTTAVATAAAALVLTGCSAESVVEKAVEAGIEAGSGADIDTDDGSVSIETDDGSMNFEEDGSFAIEDGAGNESMSGSAGSLPEGFPDDVPLLDLEITMGMRMVEDGDEGWTVAMQSPDAGEDVLEAATDLLTGAGYTLEQDNLMDTGDGLMGGRLFSGPWGVNVGVIGAPDEPTTLSYTVITPQE